MLSDVVRLVSKSCQGVLIKAEYDDQRWKLESWKNGKKYKYYVHPLTLEVVDGQVKTDPWRTMPSKGAPTMLGIVEKLEKMGGAIPKKVKFTDKGVWKADVYFTKD